MADPVGLVSLGIEACTLLVKYIGDAKDLDKETTQVLQHTQNLNASLQTLKEIAEDADFGNLSSAHLVRQQIETCRSGISKLHAEVKKCVGPDVKQSWLAKKKQQARFPVRKGDLRSLEAHLSTLQSDLQLAISTFVRQLDRVILGVGDLRLQLQSLTNTGSAAQIQELQTAWQHAQTDLIPRHDLRRRLQRSIEEDVQASAVEQAVVVDDRNEKPESALKAHDNKLGDEAAETDDTLFVVDNDRWCTCHRQRVVRKWRIRGILDTTIESISQHEPTCQYFGTTKRQKRYSTQLTPFKLPNILGISLTLQIIRGASASIISRSLVCHRIVSDDTEAFDMLIHDRYSSARTRKRLVEILASGEVSPRDASTSCSSLIMAVCIYALRLAPFPRPIPRAKLFKNILPILRDLVEAGADVNETDHNGHTPLQNVLGKWYSLGDRRRPEGGSVEIALATQLLSLGAEPIVGTAFSTHDFLMLSSDLRKRFSVSPLLSAVYERSQAKVSQILQADRQAIHGTPRDSTNVLHLAATWAEGLSVLLPYSTPDMLHSRADMGRDWLLRKATPLELSIVDRNATCVRLFIAKNSPLPCLPRYLDLYGYEKADEVELSATDADMTTIFLSSLTQRRNEFSTLASLCLETAHLHKPGIGQDGILDGDIAALQSQLGDKVAMAYRVEAQTLDEMHVYSCCGHSIATVALMQKLWDHGFRETTHRDSTGKWWTSLDHVFGCRCYDFNYIARQLRITAWLVSHGAVADCDNATLDDILLRLASRAGSASASISSFIRREGIEISNMPLLPAEISRIVADTLFDPPRRSSTECLCSSNGLCGISAFLEAAWADKHQKPRKGYRVLVSLLARLDGKQGAVAADLIRAQTFAVLQLQHRERCISDRQFKRRSWSYSPKDTASEFEKLIDRLTALYGVSGLGVFDFLEGPYKAHMEVELQEVNHPSGIDALSEIGDSEDLSTSNNQDLV